MKHELLMDLRRLADEEGGITRGPWSTGNRDSRIMMEIVSDAKECIGESLIGTVYEYPDAKLIVAARNHMGALVEEVFRLRHDLDAVATKRDKYKWSYEDRCKKLDEALLEVKYLRAQLHDYANHAEDSGWENLAKEIRSRVSYRTEPLKGKKVADASM